MLVRSRLRVARAVAPRSRCAPHGNRRRIALGLATLGAWLLVPLPHSSGAIPSLPPAAFAAGAGTGALVAIGEEPREGTIVIRPVERWRAGGDEDETLIGNVRTAAIDAGGDIYLLDNRLAQVLVYSPSGELLRTLGREGDGPGEFRRPMDLILTGDGRVGVCQGMPGKIVFLDREGKPAGSLEAGGNDPTTGGFSFLAEARARGDALVVAGRLMTRREGGFDVRRYLARLNEDGSEKVCYLESNITDHLVQGRFVERDEHFVTQGGWALGADGTVYAAPERDRYVIQAYAADGTPLRRIARDAFRPWKRTAEEKEQVGRNLVVVANGRRVDLQVEAEDHAPCIVGMHAMADGDLWVLNSRGARERPAGVFATYDVLDEQGGFARRVALELPGDPERDRLLLLDDRRLLVIKNATDRESMEPGRDGRETSAEEPLPLEVIFYEMAPAGK